MSVVSLEQMSRKASIGSGGGHGGGDLSSESTSCIQNIAKSHLFWEQHWGVLGGSVRTHVAKHVAKQLGLAFPTLLKSHVRGAKWHLFWEQQWGVGCMVVKCGRAHVAKHVAKQLDCPHF